MPAIVAIPNVVEELLMQFGGAVSRLVEEHRHTVLAARTHAQQAVPTTFGLVAAGMSLLWTSRLP